MADVFIGEVAGVEKLTETVYAHCILCPGAADISRAGQFVSFKCGEDMLLRRPVSICCKKGNELKFVFEVKGKGTKWLSGCKPGQSLDIFGPLGNGFNIPDGRIIVVGGGVGAPPLLYAAESAAGAVTAILGFRDAERVILQKEFESACENVFVTTDDGSCGVHGTVTEPLSRLLESGGYAAVLACGPRVMLSAVANLCKQHGVPCQVSLEERMACGVGACVVCACLTIQDGVQGMRRVCKDGPVFNAEEVVW